MLNDLGSVAAGLLAAASILMGARYLVEPRPAAAGFGIPGDVAEPAWLAVKAVRDMSIGIAVAALLISGPHAQLGYLLLATSLIPVADGAIVLRSGGPRVVAFGVHWSTAALFAIAAVLLLV